MKTAVEDNKSYNNVANCKKTGDIQFKKDDIQLKNTDEESKSVV